VRMPISLASAKGWTSAPVAMCSRLSTYLVTIIVVIVTVIITAIVVAVVKAVIAMILAIPVALVVVPPIFVSVVVRMAPIGACIRRTLPPSGNPDIPAPVEAPISVDPEETGARRRPPALVPQRRRRAANHDANLRKRRSTEANRCKGNYKEF
jgi:hypothetical protein